MNNLIRKISSRKLKIELISNSTQKNKLLKWGTDFISRESEYSTNISNSFIFNFKEAAVRVDSYDMISTDSDVYPTNWTLSVSNDNKDWIIIDRKDQPLCNNAYIEKQPIDNKYFCKKKDRFHFPAASCIPGYYQYVKYHMIQNSYYGTHNWRDLIKISGFELNGDYLINNKKFPTYRCNAIPKTSAFIIYQIICLSTK